MPEQNMLKDTIDVEVNGETYTFKIPSYMEEIKVGLRERDIRREVEQELGIDARTSVGEAAGLDGATFFMIQTAAQFEVLLRRSSTSWPWSNDRTGKPIVDFKKWPNEKVAEAMAVGVAYQNAIGQFRSGGDRSDNSTGTQTVEGQSNPGDQSVSS